MSRPDAHCRILALIEARIDEPLTLTEIAEACGLSVFHVSRLFTALHGESVMAHVRRRRLARAARRLIADGVPLAELAFDCGFESQQAFTRAFTRQFGVSPGRFRRSGLFPVYQPGVPGMTGMTDIALDRMDELTDRPAFRAAGFRSRFNQGSVHAIPALWRQFVPRLPVPGSRPGTLGLCFSGDPDTGDFDYMSAVELEPGARAPAGLQTAEIPAQTYSVWRLTLNGEALHPQMQAAAREIWGRRLAAADLEPSGGPDFELYPPAFDERRRGETVEFWIPVQA